MKRLVILVALVLIGCAPASGTMTVGVLNEDGTMRINGGTVILLRDNVIVAEKPNTGYTTFDARAQGRYCARLSQVPGGWEKVEQGVCDDRDTGRITLHLSPAPQATPTWTPWPTWTPTPTATPWVTTPTAEATPTVDPAIMPPPIIRVTYRETTVYRGPASRVEIER